MTVPRFPSRLAIPALAFGALVAFVGAAQAGQTLRLRAGDVAVSPASSLPLPEPRVAPAPARPVENFVVQFHWPITESDREYLRSRGLEPLRYLPDDALVVRGADRDAALFGATYAAARAVVPYAPEWKISPELLAPGARDDRFLVATFDEGDVAATAAALRAIPGVKVAYASGRDLLVAVRAPSLLGEIARVSGIEWIQRVPRAVTMELDVGAVADGFAEDTRPTGPPTGYESGTKLMGFDGAWSRGYRGRGQIAAMADTGLDKGTLAGLSADLANVTKGYVMGLGAVDFEDTIGHGTHVAGSVVGTGAASGGLLRGGAHEGSLFAVGMWSPIMDGIAFGADVQRLLRQPYLDGARLHTNSWGNAANPGAYDAWASRTDDFTWNNPDLLVIFAAGNGGQDLNRDGRIDEGSISSPGTAKNVLTVGASENLVADGGNQKTHVELRDGAVKWSAEPIRGDKLSNRPDGLAAFSSRGPTLDGRLKPEVVAPGTNIVSVRSTSSKAGPLWGDYDEHYVYAGGTSMATPLTAGAAAVVRQYLVEQRQLADPSAALVKAALIHSAHDLYPGQYGTGPTQELPTRRPNVHEGYGRVDVDAATSADAGTTYVDEATGVGLSEERSFAVSVGERGTLRATLAYTDAPGAAAASRALVNDLDLRVVGPDGMTFTNTDRLNNVEMLELRDLAPGSYQIAVKGVNVPQGRAGGRVPYAVVVSAE